MFTEIITNTNVKSRLHQVFCYAIMDVSAKLGCVFRSKILHIRVVRGALENSPGDTLRYSYALTHGAPWHLLAPTQLSHHIATTNPNLQSTLEPKCCRFQNFSAC